MPTRRTIVGEHARPLAEKSCLERARGYMRRHRRCRAQTSRLSVLAGTAEGAARACTADRPLYAHVGHADASTHSHGCRRSGGDWHEMHPGDS
eukprot:scaffold111559_cov36-Tisochrysis_lutea.AAC.1